MNTEQQGGHVCILGCGRSGTSIFGELFQTIPYYRYYSEPEWDGVKSLNYNSPVAIKVPRTTPGVTPTEGLPFILDEFLQIFPRPRVLFWQVRHPLDTICSLRVGIANNWGHHPRPPDYKEWLHRSLIEQCAHHWNFINTNGYQQVKHLVKINRFEEMILHPVTNAQRCLKFAGIGLSNNRRYIKQWASRVQDQNNKNFIEATCSKPYSRNDHLVKVGRWKDNLTRLEVESVLPIITEGAALLGYDLSELVNNPGS